MAVAIALLSPDDDADAHCVLRWRGEDEDERAIGDGEDDASSPSDDDDDDRGEEEEGEEVTHDLSDRDAADAAASDPTRGVSDLSGLRRDAGGVVMVSGPGACGGQHAREDAPEGVARERLDAKNALGDLLNVNVDVAVALGDDRDAGGPTRPTPPRRRRDVVAPPSPNLRPPATTIHRERIPLVVDGGLLPRALRALEAPLVRIGAGKMLQCFGESPGRMRGKCRLVPDSSAIGVSASVCLWLDLDGSLRLTYEKKSRRGEFATEARSIDTLVSIRPRWRGERRSLRTFVIVSLRPSPLAFNTRPRRLSTSTDAFQLHPDIIARMERPGECVAVRDQRQTRRAVSSGGAARPRPRVGGGVEW